MKIVLLILSFVTVISCSVTPKEATERQTYYIERKGAYLPVYTLGPEKSDKIVLFVHGGPGLSSVTYYYMPFIQRLAQHYKVALWDQRGTGGARGVVSLDTMTVPEFVEDMNAVYNSLKVKNPNSKIYILAHSYGGMIGGAYASKYGDQIAGSMFVSPGFNIKDTVIEAPKLMKLDVENVLANYRLNSKQRNFWEEARLFYQKNLVLDARTFLTHSDYTRKLDALNNIDDLGIYIKTIIIDLIEDNILDDLNINAQRLHVILDLEKNGEIQRNLETDLNFNLSQIRHPVLMSTGQKDRIIPEFISIQGYEKMNNGTPNSQSKRISYENTSHHGLVQASEKYFFDQVTNFIFIN